MSIGKILSKDQAMSLAIEQAQKGMGRVSPNPPVGAVIVDKNQKCLSLGHHAACGQDHAEIMALKNISNSSKDLKSAIMYVTLEPCAHHGLTLPCVEKLSSLPLAKICFGIIDPNPKVQGLGVRKLQEAGIEVEEYEGPLKESLQELIEIFDYNLKYQKPFVSLKIASSLDGQISLQNKKWITGSKSRDYVSFLRAWHDAVCIGVNTLIQDNPRLNCRNQEFIDKQNNVIILDNDGRSLSVIEDSNLLKVRDASKVIVVTPQAPQQSKLPITILRKNLDHQGHFDLEDLLRDLFKMNIRSLLVEGGGMVFESFLKKFQRIYLFSAPFIAGQFKGSVSWSQNLHPRLTPIHFQRVRWLPFDEDILMTARPSNL